MSGFGKEEPGCPANGIGECADAEVAGIGGRGADAGVKVEVGGGGGRGSGRARGRICFSLLFR